MWSHHLAFEFAPLGRNSRGLSVQSIRMHAISVICFRYAHRMQRCSSENGWTSSCYPSMISFLLVKMFLPDLTIGCFREKNYQQPFHRQDLIAQPSFLSDYNHLHQTVLILVDDQLAPLSYSNLVCRNLTCWTVCSYSQYFSPFCLQWFLYLLSILFWLACECCLLHLVRSLKLHSFYHPNFSKKNLVL